MNSHRLEQPSLLPQPQATQVWLDFDGTISTADVLDALIERYSANESWKLVEQRWQAGLIGSRECLEQEFALLRISAAELDRFLDHIHLDPGIKGLLELLASFDVPVAILSDGIDLFIHRILQRHGISGLTVRSNTVRHRGMQLELRCPHASRTVPVECGTL